MLTLVYVSSATRYFTNGELLKLLEICRANNQRLDITGLLLYKGGNFMQVLEGPDAEVVGLYQKIERDNRHRGSIKLLQRETAQRDFADWTMGFCNLDEPGKIAPEGASQFLCEPLDSMTFRENPSAAQKLLLSFKKTIR